MTTLDLIGSSPKFRALLAEVAKVAPVDSAVLIQGETGTGKEVIARAIHEASPRRNQRFVALNCAALPDTLLESELFGIEKGVATGVDSRVGQFQKFNKLRTPMLFAHQAENFARYQVNTSQQR